jgi:retron-type reverse transcriptase
MRGKIQLIHLMKNNRFSESIGDSGHVDLFGRIVSKENLFAAWREFQKGKMGKEDVLIFSEHFEEHLLRLHADLVGGRYKHGPYKRFLIHDPKLRNIAKASVRDRVLHHAICRVIMPSFDKAFVFDAYSSRKTKGVHRAIERFQSLAQKLSRNNTQTVWALKCDVRKFFDSVGHDRLLELCARRVRNDKVIALLTDILGSFETRPGNGIPLGNLTSQLFANIYLDRLDQYVKRELRVKNYLRYTDDFVLLSRDREELERVLPLIRDFLLRDLGLELHPTKVFFRKWHQGVDFLGYGHFPHYRVLRTKTKKRIIRKLRNQREEFEAGAIDEDGLRQTVASYLGVLSHSRNRGLAKRIRRDFLPSVTRSHN